MKKAKFARIEYIFAMIIYGTCGIFSKYINVSSGFIVFSRAIIGSLILALFLLIRKRKINFESIKKNFKWLVLSGVSIGLNWMCLFSSYNYVSVSVASFCNYLAPAFFIIVMIIIFKEKTSFTKIICLLIALVGILLLSGVIGEDNTVNYIGIILGILAALFYVCLLVFNRFIKDIDPVEKVLIEMICVTIVTAPYAFISLDYNSVIFDGKTIIFLLILGVFHTGFAYILYLGSMEFLPSQSIAIYSYFEPIVAVILSYFLLKEDLSILGLIGGVLILSSTFLYEILNIREKKKLVE